MNIKCEGCNENTIGLRWLYWFVFVPFLNLFMQVSCQRCKKEQRFKIFNDSIIISYIDMTLTPIVLAVLFIWALITTINIGSFDSIDFWLKFIPWVMVFMFVFLRLAIKFVYLYMTRR